MPTAAWRSCWPIRYGCTRRSGTPATVWHVFVDETGIGVPRKRATAVLDARVERARRARAEPRRLPPQGVGGPVRGEGRDGEGPIAGGDPVAEPDLRPLLGTSPWRARPRRGAGAACPRAVRWVTSSGSCRNWPRARTAFRNASRNASTHLPIRLREPRFPLPTVRLADRVPRARTVEAPSSLESAVERLSHARPGAVRQPDGARRGRQAERKRPDTGEPAGGARQAVRRRARGVEGGIRPVGTAQGEAEDGLADADEDGGVDKAGANGGDPGTGVDARQDGDRSASGTDARQNADTSAAGAGVGPSGLHAKMIAVEHGWDVTWYVGSANLTSAAFGGSNVEVMASVTGQEGAQRRRHRLRHRSLSRKRIPEVVRAVSEGGTGDGGPGA